MSDQNLPSKLEKLSSQYGDLTVIRALIQSIPYAGGPLDVLLSNGGQKWKMERLEDFLKELDQKMRSLPTAPKLQHLEKSEELYDLVHYSIEQVTKTRSHDKRKRFANIIQKQIAEAVNWDESETAVRLLSDLTEIDIEVLSLIAQAAPCGPPFEGLRVAELPTERPVDDKIPRETFNPVKLDAAVPHLSIVALRMSCSGLIARGLLKDEGVGRWGGIAMRFFVPTESAFWFLEWIKD